MKLEKISEDEYRALGVFGRITRILNKSVWPHPDAEHRMKLSIERGSVKKMTGVNCPDCVHKEFPSTMVVFQNNTDTFHCFKCALTFGYSGRGNLIRGYGSTLADDSLTNMVDGIYDDEIKENAG